MCFHKWTANVISASTGNKFFITMFEGVAMWKQSTWYYNFKAIVLCKKSTR